MMFVPYERKSSQHVDHNHWLQNAVSVNKGLMCACLLLGTMQKLRHAVVVPTGVGFIRKGKCCRIGTKPFKIGEVIAKMVLSVAAAGRSTTEQILTTRWC